MCHLCHSTYMSSTQCVLLPARSAGLPASIYIYHSYTAWVASACLHALHACVGPACSGTPSWPSFLVDAGRDVRIGTGFFMLVSQLTMFYVNNLVGLLSVGECTIFCIIRAAVTCHGVLEPVKPHIAALPGWLVFRSILDMTERKKKLLAIVLNTAATVTWQAKGRVLLRSASNSAYVATKRPRRSIRSVTEASGIPLRAEREGTKNNSIVQFSLDLGSVLQVMFRLVSACFSLFSLT
jgi:hypothetical protein